METPIPFLKHFSQRFCYTCLLLLIGMSCIPVPAHPIDYWDTLEQVKLKTAVLDDTEFLYLKPIFSKKVKRLEGKWIVLEGYFHNLGTNGFMLTKYLSSKGQYRSLRPGPKETVALEMTTPEALKNHHWIRVKGILSLNATDPNQPIYELKEAYCLK